MQHHCVWLNNCIGAANYRKFLALLCTAVALMMFQLSFGVYLVAASYTHKAAVRHRQRTVYGGGISLNGLRVVWCIYIALPTGALKGSIWMLCSYPLLGAAGNSPQQLRT